jgi:hypothetical protein
MRKLTMLGMMMNTRSVLECGSPLPLLNGKEHSLAPQSARGLAQSKTWRQFVAVVIFAALPFVSNAQSYSTDWYKVTGGGGTSTGGVYSVSGTSGQHDAGGPMTGGNFSLTGGFWSLYAVQTPGAPSLKITLNSPLSTITVSWPSPSTGYNLQVNTNLATTNWVTPVETITDNGMVKYITIAPPTGNRFYRLKNP